MQNYEQEFGFEAEQFEYADQEYGGFSAGEVFSQEQEIALANEMLAVNSEEELNYFLGDLIRQAGSAIGKAVSSPTGRAIGTALKGAAKAALPVAAKGGLVAGGKAFGSQLGGQAGNWAGGKLGQAVGSRLGNYLDGAAGSKYFSQLGQRYGSKAGNWLGSTLGGKIGGGLADMAVNALSREAETMGQEEYEFVGAQQFVRMAGDVAKRTLQAARNTNPQAAARAATFAAARQFAPGLLEMETAAGTGQANAGRWERRGNHIVLLGV